MRLCLQLGSFLTLNFEVQSVIFTTQKKNAQIRKMHCLTDCSGTSCGVRKGVGIGEIPTKKVQYMRLQVVQK